MALDVFADDGVTACCVPDPNTHITIGRIQDKDWRTEHFPKANFINYSSDPSPPASSYIILLTNLKMPILAAKRQVILCLKYLMCIPYEANVGSCSDLL